MDEPVAIMSPGLGVLVEITEPLETAQVALTFSCASNALRKWVWNTNIHASRRLWIELERHWCRHVDDISMQESYESTFTMGKDVTRSISPWCGSMDWLSRALWLVDRREDAIDIQKCAVGEQW